MILPLRPVSHCAGPSSARRLHLVAPAIAAILGAVSACGPDGAQRHPKRAGWEKPILPAATISLHSAPPLPAPAGAIDAWISSLRPGLRLGALVGDTTQEFGTPADAITDARGRIFVLDADAREIRVYDASGELWRRIGGPGRGPGEFVQPRALAVDSAGELFVFDGLGRITVFSLAGDSVRVVRTIETRLDVSDACLTHDRMLILGHGPVSAGALHVFTLAGERVGSSRALYASGNRIVRSQLSEGRLACSPGGTILVAPLYLPQLLAFDATGQLIWWVLVDDYRPLDVIEADRGSTMHTPDAGFDFTWSIVVAPSGDEALWQIKTTPGKAGHAARGPPAIRNLLVTLDSRSVRQLKDGPPPVIGWNSEGLLSLGIDPYPYVERLHP